MPSWTRRQLLRGSTVLAAGALTASAPAAEPTQASRLKVLIAGAHPDDPESGCGGTIARYVDRGYEVAVLYLTRGEAGIAGKSHDEAAAIRTAEAKKACTLLKARPLFAGQIDGATEVNAARYAAFRKIVEAEKPDVVLTHWPIDTHPDHRACSLLVYDAWLRLGRRFALYYFEVILGGQTQCFPPTHYVDITAVEPRKRDACFAHESQHARDGWYPNIHVKMQQYRGMEIGVRMAEAFVHHPQSPYGRLPDA
jgi:LmbE family N-acetylglucosaminyl deacetylase